MIKSSIFKDVKYPKILENLSKLKISQYFINIFNVF
jgi:hypothetical protein